MLARRSEDTRERAWALERLATLLYLLGAYEAQVSLDREALSLRPDAIAPRRRLAVSLLRLGRDSEARLVVSELARASANGPPTGAFMRLLGEVEQLRIAPQSVPPDAALNAIPVFDRPQLEAFFRSGAPRIATLPEAPGA